MSLLYSLHFWNIVRSRLNHCYQLCGQEVVGLIWALMARRCWPRGRSVGSGRKWQTCQIANGHSTSSLAGCLTTCFQGCFAGEVGVVFFLWLLLLSRWLLVTSATPLTPWSSTMVVVSTATDGRHLLQCEGILMLSPGHRVGSGPGAVSSGNGC